MCVLGKKPDSIFLISKCRRVTWIKKAFPMMDSHKSKFYISGIYRAREDVHESQKPKSYPNNSSNPFI